MAKLYPAIGSKKLPHNKSIGGLPCIICGDLTTGKVEIEISYFRGDDEQVRVCPTHQKRHDAGILDAFNLTNETKLTGAPSTKPGETNGS